MSSCSEFLVRQQLRATKYIDTRPKMTCGQMIEIQRQQAESAVYETFLPATACVSALNAPGTRGPSSTTIARGHRVKDASQFVAFAAANDTAAMWNPRNGKQPTARGVSQITSENCLQPRLVTSQNAVAPSTFVNQLPELQDRIVLSTLLATTDPNYRKEDIIMAARQAIGPNCCVTCGRINWREGKVNFASACACASLSPGLINSITGGPAWKNTYIYPRTVT
jgi:hypothetical protein